MPSPTPPSTLRILEVATGVAGPTCGRLFAALGHEVIKCEPAGGDPLRAQHPLGPTAAAHGFVVLNADKHSVVADARAEEGRATIEGLLEGADVLITDLPPSTARACGLDPAVIAQCRPGLVVVSVTGYGFDDGRSDRDCDSLLAEAYGGMANMIGDPDGRPFTLAGEQAATAAGFVAFFGAGVALCRRQRDGLGGVVDVAICDVAAYMDWKSDISYGVTGRAPRRKGGRSGRWRIVRAADGWVGVIYQPGQWDALVKLIGDPRLSDDTLADEKTRSADDGWWAAVTEWAAARPRAQIYEEAQALGLAFGLEVGVEDLARSPQLASRGFLRDTPDPETPVTGALLRSDAIGWRSGRAPRLDPGAVPRWPASARAPNGAASPGRRLRGKGTAGDGPLSGVRVLDFGTNTAGPGVGRLLADYGATVVKVESPDQPDIFRQSVPDGAPPSPGGSAGSSPMFESNNAGKLGVALDLKSEAGQESLSRLVAGADVIVENFRVGVTERLRIDYERLRRINPRLLYLSLSSQGQDGPEARRRSYGSTLDLLSGLASLTGEPDFPVWSSGDVNYPDQLVSLLGAGLVVSCMAQGLRPAHLDLAQLEVASWTLSDRLAEYRWSGRAPQATGNRRPGRTPHDVYRCHGEDQWVALSCWNGEQRAALAALVGIAAPEASDERWWWEHPDAIDARIGAWTAGQAKDTCVAELAGAGVPAAPVQSAAERARDPHFLRRRVFLGEGRRLKGYPLRFEGYEPPSPPPAPVLGAHDRLIAAGDWEDWATFLEQRRPPT